MNLRRFLSVLAAACLFGASQARAGDDIEFASPPTEAELDDLSIALAGVIGPGLLSPADNLGTLIFDAGISFHWTDGPDEPFWDNAFDNDAPSGLGSATARVRVGLPKQIDIGAHVTRAFHSDVGGAGAEVKWTFLQERNLMPALAVRANWTRLQGVDDLDLDIQSADVSISKKIAIVVPYAGVGAIRTSAKAHDLPSGGGTVRSSDILPTYFAGARFSILLFKATVEAQRLDDEMSYAAKFGFIFP
jgi:hypothetical protein